MTMAGVERSSRSVNPMALTMPVRWSSWPMASRTLKGSPVARIASIPARMSPGRPGEEFTNTVLKNPLEAPLIVKVAEP